MAQRGRPKQWNDGKIARLGMLIGAGWSCARIAEEMGSTQDAVRACARRLRLRFTNVPAVVALPGFQMAAAIRGKMRDDLIVEVLSILDSDRALLENVIDDRC